MTPVMERSAGVKKEQVAEICRRFVELTKERQNNIVELLDELERTQSERERQEIAKTISEILAPELIGNLRMGLKQKTSGSFLKSRARWIGRKIRVLREKKGMTQEDLAERAGLTQSHVSRLEDGKHSPSNVTLRKIAKALRVSVHKIDYEEHE